MESYHSSPKTCLDFPVYLKVTKFSPYSPRPWRSCVSMPFPLISTSHLPFCLTLIVLSPCRPPCRSTSRQTPVIEPLHQTGTLFPQVSAWLTPSPPFSLGLDVFSSVRPNRTILFKNAIFPTIPSYFVFFLSTYYFLIYCTIYLSITFIIVCLPQWNIRYTGAALFCLFGSHCLM